MAGLASHLGVSGTVSGIDAYFGRFLPAWGRRAQEQLEDKQEEVRKRLRALGKPAAELDPLAVLDAVRKHVRLPCSAAATSHAAAARQHSVQPALLTCAEASSMLAFTCRAESS